MPPTTPPRLTEAEFRLMTALWQLGSATVHDLLAALADQGEQPAYTTVLTTLQILTKKGAVQPEREGRRYRYHPLVAEEEARRSAARTFVNRFFGGSRKLLMHSLLEDEEIDRETLERLLERVDEIDEEG